MAFPKNVSMGFIIVLFTSALLCIAPFSSFGFVTTIMLIRYLCWWRLNEHDKVIKSHVCFTNTNDSLLILVQVNRFCTPLLGGCQSLNGKKLERLEHFLLGTDECCC